MSRPKRINYSKLVPSDTFISRYLELWYGSETPSAYDFWTACFLIGCATGRDVVVDRPLAPVHLNSYIVLVAESGVTRKSTAVRRVPRFLRHLGDEAILVETRSTQEKLEFDLATQTEQHGTAKANIVIDEMVKFLGREKYAQNMPTFLTDLYDSPELRTGGGTLSGTRNSKSRLQRVFINFLSASTPSWLLRAINPDVIEGGFTSRVIFVVCEEPKRSSPWPEEANEELYRRCCTDLESIRRQARDVSRIQISQGARNRFSSWYKSRELRRDPFRSSFQSREDSHVLRMAAMLCINDGAWEIQATHIASAIRIITEVREDGACIFEGTGTHSRLVLGIDALRDKLLAGGLGGCKQGQLTKHLQRWMNAEEMKTALNIMHELGFVQRFDDIKVGRGRPTTLWRALSPLVDSKSLDRIIEMVQP